MIEWKYEIVEVIHKETETQRREAIVRSNNLKTIEEAKSKMENMKPKYEGRLEIKRYFTY